MAKACSSDNNICIVVPYNMPATEAVQRSPKIAKADIEYRHLRIRSLQGIKYMFRRKSTKNCGTGVLQKTSQREARPFESTTIASLVTVGAVRVHGGFEEDIFAERDFMNRSYLIEVMQLLEVRSQRSHRGAMIAGFAAARAHRQAPTAQGT